MEKECDRLGVGVPDYEKFSQIVRKYLTKIFNLAIFKHKSIQLPLKIGKMFCAKVLCTRYTPKKWYIIDGKRQEKRFDVDKFDGYFFVMHLAFCKKYSRKYKFDASKKWKRMVFGNILNGSDYPTMGSMLPTN